jgi:hypothetical protein
MLGDEVREAHVTPAGIAEPGQHQLVLSAARRYLTCANTAGLWS